MKLIILLIAFAGSLAVKGQSSYVLENIFKLDLKFKMQRDTTVATYAVNCDDIPDTLTVTIKGRKMKLSKMIEDVSVRECMYPEGQIQTYLSSKHLSDSFYVFLDFYVNRLISFDIYYQSASKRKYVDSLLAKHFGNGHAKFSDKHIKVISLTNENGFSRLVVYDRQASEFVPPWCGNDKKRGSWRKLEKYVNSD